MAHPDHGDDQDIVVNLVHDAVGVLAHTVTLLPGELLATGRPGILDQRLDALENTLNVRVRNGPRIPCDPISRRRGYGLQCAFRSFSGSS